MMDAIESNVMENPIEDSSDFKQDVADQLQCSQSAKQEKRFKEADEALEKIFKQIEGLRELVLNTPELDKAKIELIKEELTKGRYKILSKEIAAKLFADIE